MFGIEAHTVYLFVVLFLFPVSIVVYLYARSNENKNLEKKSKFILLGFLGLYLLGFTIQALSLISPILLLIIPIIQIIYILKCKSNRIWLFVIWFITSLFFSVSLVYIALFLGEMYYPSTKIWETDPYFGIHTILLSILVIVNIIYLASNFKNRPIGYSKNRNSIIISTFISGLSLVPLLFIIIEITKGV